MLLPTRHRLCAALALALTTQILTAQEPAIPGPNPQRVSTERLGETMQTLCAAPRFAGSESSQQATKYAAQVFAEAGLEVELAHYQCYLPRQISQSLFVESSDGDWQELNLFEQGYEQDPRTLSHHIPPMHGLTFAGSAEGKLWYAGYGTEREFAQLAKKHGDAIHGGVALVRYGALYRGLKVANAEKYGFSAALLYTDEEEDGAPRGKVLPEGPWRPSSGIQRGSVYNADGDPLTPGWAAVEGAPRIALEDAQGMVGIPSLPISSGNAARLRAGAGKKLGPLPSRVRMHVEQDPTPVAVTNVIGRVTGSTHPEEWIVIGAHRDSWGYGAIDNGTGSTVLLETARVIGKALADGWRPQRTIIFASWDAEEWGLVGSTEWVEEHLTDLRKHAVAYLNMDVVATGPDFRASCTPGLVESLEHGCASRGIPMPGGVGVPGGGSDHVPFLELGGIEVLAFGFHGGSGVYHSAMDTPYLIEEFLDPEYRHHAEAASFAVTMLDHLSKGNTTVDGRRRWLQQILAAADKLPQETTEQELVRLKVLHAAENFALRLYRDVEDIPTANAFRFARHFLPEGGRSFLWRSAGYGSAWFPDLQVSYGEEPQQDLVMSATALIDAFGNAHESLRKPSDPTGK